MSDTYSLQNLVTISENLARVDALLWALCEANARGTIRIPLDGVAVPEVTDRINLAWHGASASADGMSFTIKVDFDFEGVEGNQ
ncbi:MAG: hypothetical protein CL489_06915 [Acidobacteria bacterium]|nr:hypothetical protein [Acidobacteriota bacterium]|tara:strand:+ start:597 stop:848 length:252 start_codon:yes stop_codon:yes gene_type:complete